LTPDSKNLVTLLGQLPEDGHVGDGHRLGDEGREEEQFAGFGGAQKNENDDDEDRRTKRHHAALREDGKLVFKWISLTAKVKITCKFLL
jgi:hypothetical protein